MDSGPRDTKELTREEERIISELIKIAAENGKRIIDRKSHTFCMQTLRNLFQDGAVAISGRNLGLEKIFLPLPPRSPTDRLIEMPAPEDYVRHENTGFLLPSYFGLKETDTYTPNGDKFYRFKHPNHN